MERVLRCRSGVQGTAQQRVVLLPPPRPGSSPHPPGSIQLFAHAPPMSARSRAFQALLVNLVGGGGGVGEGCGRCGFCTKLSLLILQDPEGMFHRTQCSCQRLKPQTLRIGMLRHSGSLKGSLILKPSPAHGNGMHQKAGSPIKPPDAGYFDVAA